MNIFKRAKSRLKLLKLSNGAGFDNVTIKEAPKQWEKFLGTEDSWITLNFPSESNTSACLFKGKKGSIFPPHKHSNSTEHSIITNKGGKMEVITKFDTKIIEFPNSVFFEKDEIHAVIFLEDTELIVKWNPGFNNKNAFDGDFIN